MDTPDLNLLSLCSGAGMLDIGVAAALARHGIRARTLAYAEREAAPCAALRSRMEDAALEPAPVWGGNLEQFPAADFHGVVDGIVAGFPCQPHSVAGKRRGREDERNLLPAILGIADAAGAWILFLENVAGLKKEFGYIASLLLQRGWDAEWGTLRAADAGASHRRDRWFCVAYRQHLPGGAKRQLESWRRAIAGPPDGPMPGTAGGGVLADSGRQCGELPGECGKLGSPRAAREGGDRSGQRNPPDCRRHLLLDDASGARCESAGEQSGCQCRRGECVSGEGCGELGDAARGQQCRIWQHCEEQRWQNEAGGPSVSLADNHRSGCEWPRPAESARWLSCAVASWTGGTMGDADLQREQQPHDAHCSVAWRDAWDGSGGASLPVFAPGPADPAWAGILGSCPWLAPALPDEALRLLGDRLARRDALEAVPPVHGLADGLAPDLVRARADMLRIAGNGVVPQQAACAFQQLIARALSR